MNVHPRHEAERWLAQARQDLDAARVLMESGHWNLACFHAQQAAEKGAKAFLYAQGHQDIWGHSVLELLGIAASYCPELTELQGVAGALDRYYIPTRYPNGVPGGLPKDIFSSDDARDAIERAGLVIERISRLLDQNTDSCTPPDSSSPSERNEKSP